MSNSWIASLVHRRTVAGGYNPGEKEQYRRERGPIKDERYLAPNWTNGIACWW